MLERERERGRERERKRPGLNVRKICKREREREREREVILIKKSFPGYVIKFFSDKGKSKFIYTVRADINLLTLLIVHSLQFLTQVKMMLFLIKTLTKMPLNK